MFEKQRIPCLRNSRSRALARPESDAMVDWLQAIGCPTQRVFSRLYLGIRRAVPRSVSGLNIMTLLCA